MSFGDDVIETVKVHLMPLLEKNSCEIGSIMLEWDRLKVEINSFLKNKKCILLNVSGEKYFHLQLKMSVKTS